MALATSMLARIAAHATDRKLHAFTHGVDRRLGDAEPPRLLPDGKLGFLPAEQFSSLLLIDPATKHLTVLHILYEVGFNSKSSFNALFKRKTGFTPTEYKRNHHAS